MARNLSAQTGVQVDANFLNGKLVDGQTVVGEGVNQDMVQIWQKLLSLAGITPNALADNESNGYQLLQALIFLINSEAYTKAEADGKYLQKSANLSDVASPLTSRTNLDVLSSAQVAALAQSPILIGGTVQANGVIDPGISKIGSWASIKLATGVYQITHALGGQDLIVIGSADLSRTVSADALNKTNTVFRMVTNKGDDGATIDAVFSFIAMRAPV